MKKHCCMSIKKSGKKSYSVWQHTLIDATYKTTKYTILLFFICVKTNVSYSVVVEFIIQSESAEQISEALAVIKTWNPTWNPSYFMMDYSDAEMAAVQSVFSMCLDLCDFHPEQAWERWVKDRKHGLSDVQGSVLLELLRDLANAPPNRDVSDKASDYYYYKQAEKLLQDSDVWNRNEQVQQWLTNTWLSCSQVGKVRS